MFTKRFLRKLLRELQLCRSITRRGPQPHIRPVGYRDACSDT